MLTWEGSWPNSFVRRPPWLQACSVKNKQNKRWYGRPHHVYRSIRSIFRRIWWSSDEGQDNVIIIADHLKRQSRTRPWVGKPRGIQAIIRRCCQYSLNVISGMDQDQTTAEEIEAAHEFVNKTFWTKGDQQNQKKGGEGLTDETRGDKRWHPKAHKNCSVSTEISYKCGIKGHVSWTCPTKSNLYSETTLSGIQKDEAMEGKGDTIGVERLTKSFPWLDTTRRVEKTNNQGRVNNSFCDHLVVSLWYSAEFGKYNWAQGTKSADDNNNSLCKS